MTKCRAFLKKLRNSTRCSKRKDQLLLVLTLTKVHTCRSFLVLILVVKPPETSYVVIRSSLFILLFLLCAGVVLLKKFQELYAEQESQRQELTMAEKLFDLPITMYSDLAEVDKELRDLAKVYELYVAQRVSHMTCVCVGVWLGTLYKLYEIVT